MVWTATGLRADDLVQLLHEKRVAVRHLRYRERPDRRRGVLREVGPAGAALDFKRLAEAEDRAQLRVLRIGGGGELRRRAVAAAGDVCELRRQPARARRHPS